MRNRSLRLRPMGASMVPPPVMTPTHTARYSRDHGARHQLSAQRGLRLRGARHHQKAAGVLVETMDETCARQLGQRRIQSQQGVLQGMPRIPGARMHHQPGRFVDRPATSASSWTRRSCNRLRQHLGLRAPRRSFARGPGSLPPPDRGACKCRRPTCTAPSSIQPLIRVRECSGISRARALSRRWPANSGGISRSITWNSAVIGALEATVGASGILPRFRAPEGPSL